MGSVDPVAYASGVRGVAMSDPKLSVVSSPRLGMRWRKWVYGITNSTVELVEGSMRACGIPEIRKMEVL